MNMKIPELLAPAGDMEKLRIAIAYGADAVYLGGQRFGLRAFSDNFSEPELQEAADWVHGQGRRLYVTLNMFAHNEDLVGLPDYVRFLSTIGCDAVLVADPGVFRVVREVRPELPIHLSTQANTVNSTAALFWQEQGVRRIVLGRELSIREIREIRETVSVELECFVHGAMCMSYSGRCLMSAFMTGREANRGECAQPCRWKYALVEEKRPGEYFPVEEDERGSYILNSRDLCLLDRIPELCESGVDSLKIEGRMKSLHYVATVVRVYRAALDSFRHDIPYHVTPEWRRELDTVAGRGYTEAFAVGERSVGMQEFTKQRIVPEWEFAGLVRSEADVQGVVTVEQRNHLQVGDDIELVTPSQGIWRQKVDKMHDAEGLPIETAPHPCQLFRLRLDSPAPVNTLIRRRNRDSFETR